MKQAKNISPIVGEHTSSPVIKRNIHVNPPLVRTPGLFLVLRGFADKCKQKFEMNNGKLESAFLTSVIQRFEAYAAIRYSILQKAAFPMRQEMMELLTHVKDAAPEFKDTQPKAEDAEACRCYEAKLQQHKQAAKSYSDSLDQLAAMHLELRSIESELELELTGIKKLLMSKLATYARPLCRSGMTETILPDIAWDDITLAYKTGDGIWASIETEVEEIQNIKKGNEENG